MPSYPLSSINTVLLPQFQDWTDDYGMMADSGLGNSSGNGNLYTAHYVFGLVKNNLITQNESDRILQVYANNFMENGLLCRTPQFPGDRQTQDDLFGIMGAEALLYPDPEHRIFTKNIYEYGKISTSGLEADAVTEDKEVYWLLKILTFRTRWVWNNVSPRKFLADSWLGRFMNLIATMQMAQKKLVNPLFYLYWAVSMLSIGFGLINKDNQDAYILGLHSALACQGYGPLTNWICSKVHKAIARDFGDFGQLLSVYFDEPNHPIVALCKGLS